MSVSVPSYDDLEEVLLSCRYGDVDEIKQFVDQFGPNPLNDARDDHGNTILHMNNAKSTPLHWAALNSQLSIARALVRFPQGPGIDLIDIKNAAGRSSLGEAENAGWDEGAKWFVEVMNLDEGAKGEEELHPADGTEDIEVEIQDAEGQVAKMTIGQSASETSNKDAVKT